jgi:hypothetical protein
MPRADRKLGVRVTVLEVAGTKTADAGVWAQGILEFYRGLYTDTSNDVEGRLRRLRAEAKDEGYIHLPRWIVERSRNEARQRARSAPGNDGVTWGVINALPTRVLDHFASLFEKRLNNEEEGFVKQWITELVTLIPKVHRPRSIEELRPISLSSCLQKWFLSCMTKLLEFHTSKVSRESFGFSKGKQTAEIHLVVTQLIQKKAMYSENLVIMQLDIKKAFDNINHDILERVLRSDGCPSRLLLAFFRELHGTKNEGLVPRCHGA